VRTVDIAPTLAKLLDISPSEPLDGVAIDEVLARKAKAAENK
jgi:arylsulfatase A-like enzyme